MKTKLFFLLLLIPAISTILAILNGNFLFKAAVAGTGILILAGMYLAGNKFYERVWLVIAALLLSIGGDWFLSYKQQQGWMFIAGIVLFFFAHAGYLIYALKYGKINEYFLLGILAVYLVFFFFRLSPGIPNPGLKTAALFYLLISCFSFAAAAGISKLTSMAKWGYVSGIFLILFSDTIIAFKEFTLFQSLNFLILPTYYLAQICITFSLMVTMSGLKKELRA
jgi:uncharacterized membrane protein YhhN